MKQKVRNDSGSVLKHSVKSCCENCCELCHADEVTYCIPNGKFKRVYSLDYICNDYQDCKVKIQ